MVERSRAWRALLAAYCSTVHLCLFILQIFSYSWLSIHSHPRSMFLYLHQHHSISPFTIHTIPKKCLTLVVSAMILFSSEEIKLFHSLFPRPRLSTLLPFSPTLLSSFPLFSPLFMTPTCPPSPSLSSPTLSDASRCSSMLINHEYQIPV